ncbi:crocetin glucosyltransferase 3-like [Curcuma longa]|uniref:crocetin glucosyltransferase 3-like n=1 Tax=Curcuma longa TaxID=136217 RepID=UPI003D9E7CD1
MASTRHCDGVVVLFPFLAHGHLNPCLDLARLLSKRYPSLSLILLTTDGHLPHLSRRGLPSSIRLSGLPFRPTDHGLPPDADTTFALPPQLVTRFNHAIQDSLPASFRAYLASLLEAELPLLCLIADMFLGWTAPIAEELGVFHATLYTSGPFAMSIYNSIWINLPHADGRHGDDDEIAVPGVPGISVRRRQLPQKMLSAASNPDHPSRQFVRRQAECCRRSRATLWNTAEALEKPFLELWGESTGKPVFAVGPLFSAAGGRGTVVDDGGIAAECLAWLDRQAPGSVVYVSFGSQNWLPPEEAADLVASLERHSRPFLWAAPAASQAPPQAAMKQGIGMVARGWVPQAAILGHPAVGAFVSHGGWNSTLESLGSGVPVVFRPIAGEQFLNAKLVVEVLGAGAVAAAGGAEAAEAVEEVMADEERGRKVRLKAREIAAETTAAVAEGINGIGESLRALDEFMSLVIRRR